MPLSKQLLLIRHAATDLAGKLCGHLDPPLNVAGHAQAVALADSLSAVPIHRVYSSDLLRSVQTASQLARARRIPVLARPGLREMSFGAWEGMRWADLQVRNGLALAAIESSPEASPPDGESFESFRHRVMHALNEMVFESPHQTTAVVTHLGVIRVALITLAKIDPASDLLRKIDYCRVYRFLIGDGTWTFDAQL